MRLHFFLSVLLQTTYFTVFAQVNYELRKEVNEYVNGKMPNLQTAFIAEAVKGDYRTAIVWPCVIEGKFIDDDIIGLVYKKEDKEWIFVKEIGAFRGDGKMKIAEAMGGFDFEVIKPKGLQKVKNIPDFIFEQAKEINDQLAKKNDNEAVKAIEKMATAFSIEMSGYSDGFSEVVVPGLFQDTPMVLSNTEKKKKTVQANLSMGTIQGKIFFTSENGYWAISKLGE